ncbi:hypothetical protein C8R43DRAFT_897203 [Mycena crocata]|nr:hypothetical protein C8R43DRAFT_897203 [Mycena crocata]
MSFECFICRKEFRRRADLKNHLNQPSGKCHAALHSSTLNAKRKYIHFFDSSEGEGLHSSNKLPRLDDENDPAGWDNTNKNRPLEWDNTACLDDSLEGERLGENCRIPTGFHREKHPSAAGKYGRGTTFMENFNSDAYAPVRQNNMYYPFASYKEWELASFLTRSRMTMDQIDEFLRLEVTKSNHLSFSSAKELRNRIELLPSGPQWRTRTWPSPHRTAVPLDLYYRDPVKCLEALLQNPLVQDHLEFTPYRLYTTAAKMMRVYTEFFSGDLAWELQDKMLKEATLLGTILSSDKTTITRMTGGRCAHPVLISLANINMEYRMKASHHSFMLLYLFPIPIFLHKNKKIHGVLQARQFHAILDYVLQPLKDAAKFGIMMSDPLGWRRYCYTPLVSYIIDPDEDVVAYATEAKKLGLSGVDKPFWRDTAWSPPQFLTTEILHHWHRGSWDHDVKWCKEALGASELDYRFSVLRPHTGFRHFNQGISKLKQVTGTDQRNVQRHLVCVIAEAKGVSNEVLISIRSRMEFIFRGQALTMRETDLQRLEGSLSDFHRHKQGILDAGIRRGDGGPIENWHIPKLEFMQSVVPGIRANGVPYQWTADVTEHAHIEEVKVHAAKGNNRRYEDQICRSLDRRDKVALFDLATAIATAGIDLGEIDSGSEDEAENDARAENKNADEPQNGPVLVKSSSELLHKINPAHKHLTGANRSVADYFEKSAKLKKGLVPNAKMPHRSFTRDTTAFHLSRDHVGHQMTINDAASRFQLPDLENALRAYVHRVQAGEDLIIGGHRPTMAMANTLPFQKLQIWHSVRLQSRAFHSRHQILPSQLIHASPPSGKWKYGRGDAVVVNMDPEMRWLDSGLKGHTVGQLRMIMCVVPTELHGVVLGTEGFLAYIHRFDIVPQCDRATNQWGPNPEPRTEMYAMKRAKRSDGTNLGDIIPLDRLRALVELSPRFGKKAYGKLTGETVLDVLDHFWLNKYFTKELFWILDQ